MRYQLGFYNDPNDTEPLVLFSIHDNGNPMDVIVKLQNILIRYRQEYSRWDPNCLAAWTTFFFIQDAVNLKIEKHKKSEGEYGRADGIDFLGFSIDTWIPPNINYFYRIDNPFTIKSMTGRRMRQVQEEYRTQE
jgi:hypothetical protein